MSDLQAYAEAIRVIKEAILRSQYRAASAANKEQLSLYYGIGCYVSKNSREGFWGKGAIEAISQQLQKELPGLRGFSATNIKNMRSFYEEWSPVINRQPMADENKRGRVKSIFAPASLILLHRSDFLKKKCGFKNQNCVSAVYSSIDYFKLAEIGHCKV